MTQTQLAQAQEIAQFLCTALLLMAIALFVIFIIRVEIFYNRKLYIVLFLLSLLVTFATW